MTGRFHGLTYSEAKKPLITFEVDDVNTQDLDAWKGKDLNIEVKRQTKPRSLNANAKMWADCHRIAEVTKIPPVEVYRRAVKDLGICRDFELKTEKEEATLKEAWRRLGVGWLTERLDYTPDGDGIILRCYYGSSSYSSAQMGRLIDYIQEDLRALGLETMSDREKTLLLTQWKEVKSNA